MMKYGKWLLSNRRLALPVAALHFVFFAISTGVQAAEYVDPNDCGGDAQPACYVSAAKKERDINPGNGAFRDPRKGGEWWNCDGWTRTWSAVNAWDACSTGTIFSKHGVQKKRATFIYSEKAMVDSGAFADTFKGEWWRCPSGFTRNANPVDKGEACSATIGKACDAGLVAFRDPTRKNSWKGGGYTCSKKGECGKEGNRPCIIGERSGSSCDSGLEEDFVRNECRRPVAKIDKDFDKFFANTWEGKAILDQIAFSSDVPLAYATMPGSHNSYNSTAYNYADANQYLTLLGQLKGGAHFLELDLHDFPDVRLCHSKHEKGKVSICSPGDRPLSQGLDEIRTFLDDPTYNDRILIIYFENFSKKTGEIYDLVQQKIGQHVYRSGGCKPIPAQTLTAAQMIKAGKRVLIWNGSEIENPCSDHQNFKNMVFTGLGEIGRTWEDEPGFSAIGGAYKKWTPADVVAEIETGKNLANHDFLYVNGVYKAMAWSWNENEPNDIGSEDCALQTNTARLGKGHVWNDAPCGIESFFACQNHTGEWKVTSSRGTWSEGDASCKTEFGNDYFFSFPPTAQENLALTEAKPSGAQTWINLSDQVEEGTWVGKHRWNTRICGVGKSCVENAGHPTLSAGDRLNSPDGSKTAAVMESNCNFVTYKENKEKKAVETVWQSLTAGKGNGCQLVFQADGNLVIYKSGGVPIWHSDTAGKGKGSTLHLQDNGDLVMYDEKSELIWSTSGS